jgi:hypothetical protein
MQEEKQKKVTEQREKEIEKGENKKEVKRKKYFTSWQIAQLEAKHNLINQGTPCNFSLSFISLSPLLLEMEERWRFSSKKKKRGGDNWQ